MGSKKPPRPKGEGSVLPERERRGGCIGGSQKEKVNREGGGREGLKKEQSQEPGRCEGRPSLRKGSRLGQRSWGCMGTPGSLPPHWPCDVGRGQGTHCCHSRGSRSHLHSRGAAGAAGASKAALWGWESGVGTQPLTRCPPPRLPHPTGLLLLLWGHQPLSPGLCLLLRVLSPESLGPPPAGGRSGRLLAPDVLNWGRG